MTDFIEGENRYQSTLFPERLDDYVCENSAVRVIDVFVGELDLSGLGFKEEPNELGRPGYHPATMLKIYIYGYLNQVQSSRRLEREAQRNVELMWLTGRLAPDFKTIADFRKDNGEAIRLVCREFVLLCRPLNLFTDAFVAIDSSKFKAVNNRDRNWTKAKLKRQLQRIDETIDRYLTEMVSADRQESVTSGARSQRLRDKIGQLQEAMRRLKKYEARLKEAPGHQISETDPDARSMQGRGGGLVGYNVQAAVDAQHHLIVAHEVTNVGSDRRQLKKMSESARSAIGTETLEVVTDRGYYNGDELNACDQAGIRTYLPRPNTSANRAKGMFSKRDFIYKPDDDEYECPAGERLIYRMTRVEYGKTVHRYWSSACAGCAIKSKCTTGVERRVSRYEFEAVLDEVQARLDREPERMRVRRQTVEHHALL